MSSSEIFADQNLNEGVFNEKEKTVDFNCHSLS